MSDIKKIKDDYIDKLNTENNIEKVNNIKSELFGKNGIISNEFKKLGSISVEKRKELASDLNNIKDNYKDIKITKLAKGLASGTDLEYSDFNTLSNAFENRENSAPSMSHFKKSILS